MFWEAVLFLVPLSFILYFFLARRWSRTSKLVPPGPRQLPLLGNLLDILTFNHMTMRDLAKKYGDIYLMNIMGHKVFVVTNIDLAREALVRKGHIFAGRSFSYVIHALFKEKEAILFGDYGARWRLLRKVVHSALRMFGNGIENLEQKVHHEVDELCHQLSKSGGVPTDPARPITLAVMNIIWSCLFEARFPEGSPYVDEILEMMDEAAYLAGSTAHLDLFPFMKFLAVDIHKRIKHSIDLREKLISSKFRERKQTYKEGTIRDITDALLKAHNDAELEDSKNKGLLDEDYLINTIVDLATAGTDTSASFLIWSFLYMAVFPEVQAKVHQEIENVIGRETKPRYEDRSNLPYLEATINEILRHSSIINATAPHKVLSDTTIGKYEIPQNSAVIFDLRAIHYNQNHWRDPETFDPTRFLDEDGGFICPSTFSFLPFGAGQRVCVGQVMAKMKIFLFISNVLQRFSFKLSPGSPPPDLEAPVEPVPRGILVPRPYKLCITKRD